jgi:mannose-6-phosphate isomerase-like protein (cupin superfamily)
MTDFSIANLRTDVADSAKEFGFSPTLEAHFGKKDLESEKLSVSYQRVAPNETSPFAHRHKEQAEEIYVVVEGSGRVLLDGEARDVKEWDAVRVSGPVVRSFEAGADGLAVLAFGEINPTNDAELIMPDDESSEAS